MTEPSLKARFARLGPVQVVSRVPSGSPGAFLLTMPQGAAALRTVTATHELARRGIPVLRAKRAVEALMETGRAHVALPVVEDAATLVAALAACGIEAQHLDPTARVDAKAIREALGLTQEQFALRFGLELAALRNWETGRREPDTAARSYLRVIARQPDAVEAALAAG